MSRSDLSSMLAAMMNENSYGKCVVDATLNWHNGYAGIRDFSLNADFISTDSAEEPEKECQNQRYPKRRFSEPF